MTSSQVRDLRQLLLRRYKLVIIRARVKLATDNCPRF
jgi:hypothetical protein